MQYKRENDEKVETDRLFLKVLHLLRSEIAYGVSTLPECCFNVSNRLGTSGEAERGIKQALINVRDRMKQENGKDFGEVFGEEINKAAAKISVDPEGLEIFAKFAENKGFSDIEAQIRALDLCAEMLEERIEERKKKNGEKGRLAVKLGLLGGILIVILLI